MKHLDYIPDNTNLARNMTDLYKLKPESKVHVDHVNLTPSVSNIVYREEETGTISHDGNGSATLAVAVPITVPFTRILHIDVTPWSDANLDLYVTDITQSSFNLLFSTVNPISAVQAFYRIIGVRT